MLSWLESAAPVCAMYVPYHVVLCLLVAQHDVCPLSLPVWHHQPRDGRPYRADVNRHTCRADANANGAGLAGQRPAALSLPSAADLAPRDLPGGPTLAVPELDDRQRAVVVLAALRAERIVEDKKPSGREQAHLQCKLFHGWRCVRALAPAGELVEVCFQQERGPLAGQGW